MSAIETTPSSSKPTPPPSNPSLITELNPNGYKPCCVCNEPKATRDQCFMTAQDGEVECKDRVEEYKVCMRGFGFKV
ncbi:cysteine alpha-hairpin motif superfamily [Mrakia frigida]|uniref:copper metallochaperone COX17 n=1 Tax=Mrakia frigida TaxID=29902 RepID=UPI003FCC09B4